VDRPDRADGASGARPDPSRHAAGSEQAQAAKPQPTPAPAPETADGAVAIPEGVDPELWSLLTTEERAHFARFAAMGGVTYGPESSTQRPFVRGQRLDLRI
jgi:hypothetical protein